MALQVLRQCSILGIVMGAGKGKIKRVKTQSSFAGFNAFKQKYSDAIDYLDDQFAYFLTHVLNIGAPKEFGAIPTACVGFPHLKEGHKITNAELKDFEFLFNPKFADELDEKEMGFVLSHETMHILLNHLKLANDFDDKQLANIAMDAVINDYLVDMGLELPALTTTDPLTGEEVQNLVTGENSVGYNCANSTVTEVYYDLKKKSDEMKEKLKDMFGEGGIDSHDWMHGQAPGQPQEGQGSGPPQGSQERKELEDALDKLAEGMGQQMPQDVQEKKEDEARSGGQRYSLSNSVSEQQFSLDSSVKLQWAKLLKKIEPDIFKKKGPLSGEPDTWSRSNRKLGGFPGLLLPGTRDDEPVKKQKPSIVLALDTSGSIGRATANKFINLAKSIPEDKVDLRVCTFTTTYRELDLDNPKFGSGGTCFSAVEQFIQEKVMPENKNKYPKAVVVITDGEANFSYGAPDDVNHDSWNWLINTAQSYNWCTSNNGYSPVGQVGEAYKLDDFC